MHFFNSSSDAALIPDSEERTMEKTTDRQRMIDTVNAYFQAVMAGDLGKLAELFHPDARQQNPFTSVPVVGTAAVVDTYRALTRKLSHIQVKGNYFIVEGSRLVTELDLRFQDKSGKRHHQNNLDVFTIEGGKIRELVVYGDPAYFKWLDDPER